MRPDLTFHPVLSVISPEPLWPQQGALGSAVSAQAGGWVLGWPGEGAPAPSLVAGGPAERPLPSSPSPAPVAPSFPSGQELCSLPLSLRKQEGYLRIFYALGIGYDHIVGLWPLILVYKMSIFY